MEVKNNNEQFIDDCRKIQAEIFFLSEKLSGTVDAARRAGIRQGVSGQEIIAGRIKATMRPLLPELRKGEYLVVPETDAANEASQAILKKPAKFGRQPKIAQ